ncbi:hypothetical protein EAH89_04885 [Roseomonas nepalensis]|uniref:Uncharacterized protein n=2 Tax=Muricoccus nepalensis TaxID=1854500 RepID=A0A502GE40_9PROT|nr:hypothetical protein EAH89_04885 [Roseomonas nepalensis]
MLVAVPGALLGFGGWVWLTGPGTSVPNALMALLSAVLCGRGAWWVAARLLPDRDAPEDAGEAGARPAAPPRPPDRHAAPPPAARRGPPPADPEPWRRPEGDA